MIVLAAGFIPRPDAPEPPRRRGGVDHDLQAAEAYLGMSYEPNIRTIRDAAAEMDNLDRAELWRYRLRHLKRVPTPEVW
jgi:hypothetical protein